MSAARYILPVCRGEPVARPCDVRVTCVGALVTCVDARSLAAESHNDEGPWGVAPQSGELLQPESADFVSKNDWELGGEILPSCASDHGVLQGHVTVSDAPFEFTLAFVVDTTQRYGPAFERFADLMVRVADVEPE